MTDLWSVVPEWLPLFLMRLLAFVLAILPHEVAHGLAALALGDTTAKRMGRLSLNPIRHVDPVGTILVPAVLVMGQLAATGAVGFAFGWAKPVPVDFLAFRNPRRGMILVAAAGPAMNFALAILAGLLFHLAFAIDPTRSPESDPITYFLALCIAANLVLGLFNLLPIPPLDGGRIVTGLLPRTLALPYMRLERFGILIVLFSVFLVPRIFNGFDPIGGGLLEVVVRVFNFVLELTALAFGR